MTDEHAEDTQQSDAPVPGPEQESAEDKHPLKSGIREGAAKAWGIAVEVGALLGGESGQIVEAERDLAEASAEDLLDRIDGEG